MIRAHPFRRGLVVAQDLALARVRVQFPDLDNMKSYWLPVLARKSQNDKYYAMPDIGEQVACLMDENFEDGVVLGAIYSDVDAVPVQSADKARVTFKDAAYIEYDRAAHTLTVSLPAGSTINITGVNITINASGSLNLGGAGGAAVARVGDQVQDPQGGVGTIISGSAKVFAA